MAQEVQASNDPLDYPSSYRYAMNGTELSTLGIGSINLAPLSASLWGISPEDFSNTMVGGNLQKINASTANALPTFTIPYISCDDSNVMVAIADSFNTTDARNVLAAVLYSEVQSHCNISNALAVAGWLNLLTVSNMDQARQVAELGSNDGSLGIIQILPDLSSLPPGTQINPPRRGSPIPMIILYALTSMITVLLLVVIVGGAIKARRHPERYGPRNIIGRPRQSRAKGIAMAMLETLPIVRFGDPDPKHAKSVEGERDVEMTATTNHAEAEDNRSKPGQQSHQTEQNTTASTAETSQPTTQQATTDETATSSATPSNPNPTPTPGIAAQPADPANQPDNSLGCSICTEDFTLGEELRVLPCDHKFHPLCVDPWLLNVSGTCPLCRIDLRPAQETATDETATENGIPVLRRPLSGLPQRRSTIGGIMRGTRGLDRQSIVDASREERIRILRRWREERRRGTSQLQQQEAEAESRADGTANADANPNANLDAQRGSRRFSQWLREGFSVRPTSQVPNDASAETGGERPRSWYAGESNAGADAAQAPAPARTPERSSDAGGLGVQTGGG